jgi:hypothetical protein
MSARSGGGEGNLDDSVKIVITGKAPKVVTGELDVVRAGASVQPTMKLPLEVQ